MSVLDDWRDLSTGRVRVETGEPTPEERDKLRKGSIVFVVGIVVASLTRDLMTAFLAMAVAGVFVRLYYGQA